MQCFHLPKKLINDILGMIRRFWWSKSQDKNSVAWISWDRICRPKNQGGMGFRDLSLFNRALLAKQGWRLVKNLNSLLGTVLKYKYFRNSNFLEANLGSRPSFVWRSILIGREVLSKGLRWVVGDGKSINIWQQPWIPVEPTFKVYPSHSEGAIQTVDQLISHGRWDSTVIATLFLPHEIDSIQTITICQNYTQNHLIWHFNNKGVYTVKSGYNLALRQKDKEKTTPETSDSTSMRKTWNYLWSASIPPKIRAFLWRTASNCLPCASNLQKRSLSDGICSICRNSKENWVHCFFDCPWIRKFWKESSDFEDLAKMHHNSFLDFALYLANSRRQSTDLLFTILWFIWLERNNAIFKAIRLSCSKIWNLSISLLLEYQKANSIEAEWVHTPPLPAIWIKPDEGTIKANVDACFKNGQGTVGVAIRDHNGTLMCAISINLGNVPSVEFAECYAILCGTLEATRIWSGKIIVESDSSLCIARINSDEDDISPTGSLVVRIRRAGRIAKCCSFAFVGRSSNAPADLLANLGFSIPSNLSDYCNWGTQPPKSVLSAILADSN